MNIILASGSQVRQKMLQNIGLQFSVHPADLDEEKLMRDYEQKKLPFFEIAHRLSYAKAQHISKNYPDHYVIGADQILVQDDQIFMKSANKSEAFQKIKMLQGTTHFLKSSVSVVYNGEEKFHVSDKAAIKMRHLHDDQIERYCEKAGEALTRSVAAYEYEGLGPHIIEEADGDFFTILGMPLLPLSGFLLDEGLLK